MRNNHMQHLLLSCALIILFAPFAFADGWQGMNNKHSFPENFPAGKESDGRSLYITQCDRTDRTVFVGVNIDFDGNLGPAFEAAQSSSWHIGKAGTHLKDGATYSFGGREYDCKRHIVFAPENPDDFKWVSGANGWIPLRGAIRGFNLDEGQVVCRAPFDGGIHPGKLIPQSGACYFGFGGAERASQTYEVLVAKRYLDDGMLLSGADGHRRQEDGMHSCPVGYAIAGLHEDNNYLLCAKIETTGEKLIDRSGATQRADMHACPNGWVARGVHIAGNHLICAKPKNQIISHFVDGDNESPAQLHGMHVCPKKGSGSAVVGIMVGIRADRNDFLCATVEAK